MAILIFIGLAGASILLDPARANEIEEAIPHQTLKFAATNGWHAQGD
jgi:hypothetical protein